MKAFLPAFLILILTPQNLTAATVLLQFDSVVENIIGGLAPPRGTAISVNILYETNIIGHTSDSVTFFSGFLITHVTVGGSIFSMRITTGYLGADPDAPGWLLDLTAVDFLSPRFEGTGRLDLMFRSGNKFFDDATRLPESLSQWNLAATDMSMTFWTNPPFGSSVQPWGVSSRSVSNLSLSIVPEPSVASFALFGLFLFRHWLRHLKS